MNATRHETDQLHEAYLLLRDEDAEIRIGAFEALARYIRSVAMQLTWTLDIDDIVQEVFLILGRNYNKFDPERGEFRSWLWRIISNQTRKLGGKQSRRGEMSSDPSDPDGALFHALNDQGLEAAERAEAAGEAAEIVAEILPLLAPEEIQLWRLRGNDGNNLKETAEIMGLSHDAARARWVRLARKIKGIRDSLQ